MLIIYKGRESQEKRREIYRRISLENTFTTLITPTQNTLTLEQEYLEATGAPGLFLEDVTSFERLRSRLSTEVFSGNEGITQAGERILLAQILRETKKELRVLGRASEKEGFLDEIRSLFVRFVREGVGPQELQEVIDLEREGLSRERLLDLHTLYSVYIQKLEEKEFDLARTLELFEEQGHRFSLYSPHSVWVIGFKNLSLPEIRMLQAMEVHTGVIHLVLPWEPQELFLPTQLLIDRLKKSFSTVEEIYLPSEPTPLSRFAGALLGKKEVSQEYPLTIFEGKDLYAEAEYIGLDILRRLREDPELRPEDIRILAADLTSYGPVFGEVFSTLEIPLFRDERRLILHARLLKAVFSLLRTIQRGFPADLTLSFLKHIVSPERWAELDRFENYVLTSGVSGVDFASPFPEEYEPLRRHYLSAALRFPAQTRTTSEHCHRLRELLEELNFSGHIEREALEYQEESFFEEAMVLSQIWNRFYEALEQLETLSGEEPISFARFITSLQSAVATLSVAIIPPSRRQVTLSDLSRSLPAPIRILYVCGINEALLPGNYSRALLLEDEQRERIAQFAPGFTDIAELRERGEELDLYTQLSLTGDYLTLSYALSDIEGSDQRASLYIDRALEIGGKQLISGASENYLEDLYYLSDTMSLRYAMNALAQKKSTKVHGLRQETLDEWAMRVHQLDSPAPIDRRKGDKLRTSATALETFSKCPFLYFMRHDLKAAPRKAFRVEPSDLGTFYHSVVEEVVKDIVETGRDLEEAIADHIGAQLSKKQFAPYLQTAANTYFLERAKEVCRFILGAIQENLSSSHFTPARFEQEIHLDGENFHLYGLADRIDENDEYFLLIDYKSGKKTFDIRRIYAGIDLQLSLYTMGLSGEGKESAGSFYLRIYDPAEVSAEERARLERMSGALLADPELAKEYDTRLTSGASSVILPLKLKKDGDFDAYSSVLTPPQYDALLSAAMERSEEHAGRILLGDVSVSPLEVEGTTMPCDYCDFAAVCRFEKRSTKFVSRKLELMGKEELREILEGGAS